MENKIADNALIKRVARHLLIYASFIPDLSLYHGKMGIVLFFANYARYTKNPLHDKFAGELLNEIYEEIHTGLPVNFESGLCGIGWGIEYLLQNGFIEGNSDEILSEIDTHVMERDLRRITDYSVRTGLEGISYYIFKRINSPFRKNDRLPFDETYLAEWKSFASSISIPNDKIVLDAIINIPPTGEDITSWEFGLETGCAGVGLKKILP